MGRWRKTTYLEYISTNLGPAASPIEGFALNHSAARRQILVPWDARQQAVLDFLGYAQTQGQSINRVIPHAYADYGVGAIGIQPFMYCTRTDPIEPWGAPDSFVVKGQQMPSKMLGLNDIARFYYAKITLQYEALAWDVFDDQTMVANGWKDAGGNADESTLTRFVVKEYAPSGQMLTLPKGCMRFVTGRDVSQQTEMIALTPPKFVPYWNVRITHKLVPQAAVQCKYFNPSASPGAINAALGKVNHAAFPAAGPFSGAFPAGTLLYVAAVITPYSYLGMRVFDIQHHFQCSDPNRQNFVPWITTANGVNPPVFGWVEISTDGNAYSDAIANNGKHIYDAADIAKLFQAP